MAIFTPLIENPAVGQALALAKTRLATLPAERTSWKTPDQAIFANNAGDLTFAGRALYALYGQVQDFDISPRAYEWSQALPKYEEAVDEIVRRSYPDDENVRAYPRKKKAVPASEIVKRWDTRGFGQELRNYPSGFVSLDGLPVPIAEKRLSVTSKAIDQFITSMNFDGVHSEEMGRYGLASFCEQDEVRSQVFVKYLKKIASISLLAQDRYAQYFSDIGDPKACALNLKIGHFIDNITEADQSVAAERTGNWGEEYKSIPQDRLDKHIRAMADAWAISTLKRQAALELMGELGLKDPTLADGIVEETETEYLITDNRDVHLGLKGMGSPRNNANLILTVLPVLEGKEPLGDELLTVTHPADQAIRTISLTVSKLVAHEQANLHQADEIDAQVIKLQDEAAALRAKASNSHKIIVKLKTDDERAQTERQKMVESAKARRLQLQIRQEFLGDPAKEKAMLALDEKAFTGSGDWIQFERRLDWLQLVYDVDQTLLGSAIVDIRMTLQKIQREEFAPYEAEIKARLAALRDVIGDKHQAGRERLEAAFGKDDITSQLPTELETGIRADLAFAHSALGSTSQ